MPNFFRDSTLGFKPRSNIFNKLRPKENNTESNNTVTKNEGNDSSSIMNYIFSDGEMSVQTNETEINSYNNSENIKKLSTSTPRTIKKVITDNKIVNEDDEDFEITEIRNIDNVLEGKTEISQNLQEQNVANNIHSKDAAKPSSSDTSSNDVLLEAFTNTQKICSTLKLELQKSKTENKKLTSKVKDFEEDTKNILDKINKYRIFLDNLHEKNSELFKKMNSDRNNITELKKFQEELQKKITKYKDDVNELKNQMLDLQKIKNSLESELVKKNKDLQYITQELDDCSGQLTEEKMKNSSLLDEIVSTRNVTLESIESKFRDFITQNGKLYSDATETLYEKFENNNTIFLNKQEELITKSINTTSDIVNKKFDNDLKLLLHEEVVKLSNLFNNLDKSLLVNFNNFQNGLDIFQTKTVDQLVSTEIKNDEALKVMSQNFDNKCEILFQGTKSELESIHQRLQNYQTELTKVQVFENNVRELERQIASLEQQKIENLTNLGTRNAELEELRLQLETKSIELANTKETDIVLNKKIDTLTEESGKIRVECKNLNEVLIMERSNFENKLAAQEGISTAIKSENASLTCRIKELEQTRKSYEIEQTSRLDKFQTLNEQLQKMNVEVIQLKANELELLEKNRNLNEKLVGDTTGYEESISEIKKLRRKISDIENDKQELVSDRLDLQDKLEMMEKNLKAMGSKNIQLADEIEEMRSLLHQQSTTVAQKLVTETVPASPSNHANEQVSEEKPKNRKTQKSSAKKVAKVKKMTGDEFDLPSSLTDDFEMTNPSPIHLKPTRSKSKRGYHLDQSISISKKKLLIPESPIAPFPDSIRMTQPRRKKKKT